MKQKILQEIKKIEKQENIKVIFLIESGSRAWGWESEDSDYDIRGIFIQDYNKFQKEKEQIDKIIGDSDIVLWDLKKFFRLMSDSNPSVWEWLSSDIIYKDNPIFQKLKLIFKESFNRHKLKKHYLSMARQNFEKYINTENTEANLKKYVYVLRSIACINFIEKTSLPPPKNYREVIEYLPGKIKAFFEKVVKEKKESESLKGKRDKEVEDYVTSFWNKEFNKNDNQFNIEQLELIFKSILNQNVYKSKETKNNSIFPGNPQGLPDESFNPTLVFIDETFLEKLSKHLGNGKYLKFDKILLTTNLAKKQNLSCKDIFYYTASPFQSKVPTNEEKDKKEGYNKFINKLREKGVIVREGRCQRLKCDGNFVYKQKAVDILLAMDLMSVPLKYPEVKKIILISSDSDFVPVVENLYKNEVKTILYTYYERIRDSQFSISNHLIKSVYKYALLNKQDFENARLITK